ncbi:MAG: class I SAM-dependent methyltransferase [Proteobacteria bacterium]|nr:class I SAM-dependent methyltransferase [Pseudomonadota bacterium]
MTGSKLPRVPYLSAQNNLLQEKSVWHLADASAEIDYSDGAETERSLETILKNATDLSWRSADFSKDFEDWALNYHLSPVRANILRGLSLKPGGRVLEVGAGCGVITRFLGDNGFEVDAIEGSQSRAALAVLRCSGLTNVSIVQADFNKVTLPNEGYDVVLFIGVLEYARRFSPQFENSVEAVAHMLRRAARVLAPDGVIVVAIENRMGAKYLFGGAEDHLSRPWAGIAGYPRLGNEAGICTFDAKSWSSIVSSTGLQHSFFYPLPDYKMPAAVISQPGVNLDGAHSVTWRYPSVHRAENSIITSPMRVQTIALEDAGLLPETADSFGLVLTHESTDPKQFLPFGWIIFDDAESSSKGLKYLDPENGASWLVGPDRSVFEVSNSEPVSRFWLRTLVETNNLPAFAELVESHADQVISDLGGVSLESLQIREGGRIEEGMFLRPGISASNLISTKPEWLCKALEDFWLIGQPDLESLSCLQDCDDQDSFSRKTLSVMEAARINAGRKTTSAVYWAMGSEDFNEINKVSVDIDRLLTRHVTFLLPKTVLPKALIRFDPSDHEIERNSEQAKIETFALVGGKDEKHFDLIPAIREGRVEISPNLEVKCINKSVYLEISGSDPWMVLDLKTLGLPSDFDFCEIHVTITWE